MPKSKLDYAKRLVELFSARKQIEKTFCSYAAELEKHGMRKGGDAFRIMAESDIVDEIISQCAKVFAKNFTIDDLQRLCEFHSSPLATKFKALSPQINKEIASITEKNVKKELERIQGRTQ
jgi:hypothetical protein